jgi:hypothetical protein
LFNQRQRIPKLVELVGVVVQILPDRKWIDPLYSRKKVADLLSGHKWVADLLSGRNWAADPLSDRNWVAELLSGRKRVADSQQLVVGHSLGPNPF